MDQNNWGNNESIGTFGSFGDEIPYKTVGGFSDAGLSRYEEPDTEVIKPKRLNLPFVTILLVLANLFVAVFLLIIDETHITTVGLNYVYIVKNHELLRLVSSLFLNLNATYLLGNVIALAIVGNEIEKKLGSLKTFLIYIVSGVGGNGIVLLVAHFSRLKQLDFFYGASAAVFGIVSAYFILCKKPSSKAKVFELVAIIILSIIFAVIAFTHGTVSTPANVAGIVFGAIVAFVFRVTTKSDKEKLPFKLAGIVLCIAVCVICVFDAKSDRIAKHFEDPRVEFAKNENIEIDGEDFYTTYGEALDYYCTSIRWEGFLGTNDKQIVEVNATAPIDGVESTIVIQFTIYGDCKGMVVTYYEVNEKRKTKKYAKELFKSAARAYILNH